MYILSMPVLMDSYYSNTDEKKLQRLNNMPLANRIITLTFMNKVKQNDTLRFEMDSPENKKNSL